MADQPGYGYREIMSTVLDVLAVLAVAVGVGLALLPRIGWPAVGVAGAVLYAGVHADALADVTRRLVRRGVAEVRKRRAAAVARKAAAVKAAAAEQKRQAAAEAKALAALPEMNGGSPRKVGAQ